MMRLRKEVGRKASAFKNTAMSEGGRKEVGRKRRKDWMLSVSEGPRYSYDSAQNFSCRILCVMSHVHYIVDLHESAGHG